MYLFLNRSSRVFGFSTLFVFMSYLLPAVEGMWLPIFLEKLNADEMKAMGMRISVDDIYHFQKASLKDAIVIFGGGCTGEMISPNGLLLTNHHCGYGIIQSHSSVENDLLSKGFWAKNSSEELKNDGLSATFIRMMEDVTDKVLSGDNDDLSVNILAVMAEYQESHPDLTFEIKPFYYGNQYIIVGKEIFKDVRLVGAPPSAIGKYGSDTDNWMWPRHTGDFAVFRVYADANNNPAAYAVDNVPYRSRKHLTINAGGVKEGDFTMVFGFPGRTQQYLPAREIEYITQVYNPERIEIRDLVLANLDRRMRASDEVRIKYASKYARISNAWKKWRGENIGIRESNGIERKKNMEFEFRRRLLSKPEWNQKYGYVLDSLNFYYARVLPFKRAYFYYAEIANQGVEALGAMQKWIKTVEKYEAGEMSEEEVWSALDKTIKGLKKDYAPEADQESFAILMPLYLRRLGDLAPYSITSFDKKNNGDWKTISEEAFNDKFFVDFVLNFDEKTKVKKFIKRMKKNHLYYVANGMVDHLNTNVLPSIYRLNDIINQHQKTYMEALMVIFNEKRFYPDANFTMRVSYGKVEGFAPVDAVKYHWQTTHKGILEKYIPGDYEFNLPDPFLELLRSESFGRYVNEQGLLPVCFVASNHTTGGNSGSPALNADGHFIGLNFDRAWEGTMSDLNYDIKRCRNIMVDARYILWVIEHYAGAGYLLDEMDIVW
ncbi:MAG: S46 family peptidase [Cryomorphaceae bacterium]|nr:S46 family peptidase [Cryomorphaceae bacterium]